MIETSHEIGEEMEIRNDFCQDISAEDLGTMCHSKVRFMDANTGTE
jgi:hypothetical protein